MYVLQKKKRREQERNDLFVVVCLFMCVFVFYSLVVYWFVKPWNKKKTKTKKKLIKSFNKSFHSFIASMSNVLPCGFALRFSHRFRTKPIMLGLPMETGEMLPSHGCLPVGLESFMELQWKTHLLLLAFPSSLCLLFPCLG